MATLVGALVVTLAAETYATYQLMDHNRKTKGAFHEHTKQSIRGFQKKMKTLKEKNHRSVINDHSSFIKSKHKKLEAHLKKTNDPFKKIRFRDPITGSVKTKLPRDWRLAIAQQKDWLDVLDGKTERDLFDTEILNQMDNMDEESRRLRADKRRPDNTPLGEREAIRRRVDDAALQQSRINVDIMDLDSVSPRIPEDIRNVNHNHDVKVQHVVRHEHTPFRTSGRYAHEYLGRRHKFYSDITRLINPISTAGASMYLLNPITSGTGIQQRLRNLCMMDSIYIKAQFKGLPLNELTWVAVHLLLDMHPKGVTLTSAELRETTSPMDFNLVKTRFITIKRWDVGIIGNPTTPTSASMAIIDEEVPIKKVVEYRVDGPGDITNISRGALYIHIVTNFPTVSASFVSRIKFQDVTQ